MTNNKMHHDELDIDIPLLMKLLSHQFPEMANLPVKQVQHFGTDNAIFRLGEDKSIRLPRRDSAAQQVKKEQEWLPKLAPHLPLAIPDIIGSGKPGGGYPYDWLICDWIPGINAYDGTCANLEQAAKDLAHFIKALQGVSAECAPVARRGLPLATQDKEVRKAIAALNNMFDIDAIASIWEECLNAPEWEKPPAWLHGDLLPSNLLIQNGKLSAVIDFGLSGVGDPACDLIPAWNLFDASSREIFKSTLDVDDDSWVRGKGWALSIAVIIIPYYLETNPVLVSVAKHMINEILADRERKIGNI